MASITFSVAVLVLCFVACGNANMGGCGSGKRDVKESAHCCYTGGSGGSGTVICPTGGYCYKLVSGDAISKLGCSVNPKGEFDLGCGHCEGKKCLYCCDGYKCNESTTLQGTFSVTLMVILTLII